jgi:hypothetical protein
VGDQLALWVHHYNWHRLDESLHGDTPIDQVCQRADKTPTWLLQIRHHAVEIALRALK